MHWIHHPCDEPAQGAVAYTARDSAGDRAHGGDHPPQVQLDPDPAEAEHLWGGHDPEVTLPWCQVGVHCCCCCCCLKGILHWKSIFCVLCTQRFRQKVSPFPFVEVSNECQLGFATGVMASNESYCKILRYRQNWQMYPNAQRVIFHDSHQFHGLLFISVRTKPKNPCFHSFRGYCNW